jgi:hypothetical protein
MKSLPVKHERTRSKSADVRTTNSLQRQEPAMRTTMNFNVPEEFHREFKIYAAQHGLKMVEVLERSFRLLKDQHGS